MVVVVFGAWIVAAILFYVAQRPTLSNSMKWALRIIGFLLLTFPFWARFVPFL